MSLETARWFRDLGACRGCGRKATGHLMDHRNDNMGPYCQRCAERAIRRAKKAEHAGDALPYLSVGLPKQHPGPPAP